MVIVESVCVTPIPGPGAIVTLLISALAPWALIDFTPAALDCWLAAIALRTLDAVAGVSTGVPLIVVVFKAVTVAFGVLRPPWKTCGGIYVFETVAGSTV